MKKLEKLSGFLLAEAEESEMLKTGVLPLISLMLWKKASVYMGILRVFFGKYLD